MDLKTIICLLTMIITAIAVLLPNSIINTRSCKRNWVVVVTILASALIMIDKYLEGLVLLGFLLFGIWLNVFICSIVQPMKQEKLNHDRH